MKSSKVYAALKEHLAPVLRTAGFKRAKAMLSWARPQQDKYLVMWCQVSQDGWDSYAGAKFTVEFQLSDEPIVGARHIRRQRFPKMLDSTGREEIRTIQNKVIASLQYPPAHYPALHTSETVRAWYLEKFRRIDHPYGDLDDIWLRYGSEEHLATWAQFIIRKLPDCFEQAETWASKG
jgi:hypothetical protein